MSGGGAGWAAVFSPANSMSQGSRTGTAQARLRGAKGGGAWVGAFEAEGDAAAAETKMKWHTVQ